MKTTTKTVIKIVLGLLIILVASLALPAQAQSPKEVIKIMPLDIKEYAHKRVVSEWDESQWDSFNKIVIKESKGWKVTKNHNPKLSTAYGLMGFLNSTWKVCGKEKTEDPYIQIDCGIKYVKSRYNTPDEAWKFHQKHNYY